MQSEVEQLEFARTVEGAFSRGLAADLDAALKAKLRASGLELDRPLLPTYPAAAFHGWLSLAAAYVYPSLPAEEAVRLVGRRSATGLEDTAIGRVLGRAMKLIGPRRCLERVEHLFRNNGNYQVVRALAVGQRGGRLSVGFTFGLPSFYQGVFEQALANIGARNPLVLVAASTPPSALFELSWE